jgi:hypothetical protein
VGSVSSALVPLVLLMVLLDRANRPLGNDVREAGEERHAQGLPGAASEWPQVQGQSEGK